MINLRSNYLQRRAKELAFSIPSSNRFPGKTSAQNIIHKTCGYNLSVRSWGNAAAVFNWPQRQIVLDPDFNPLILYPTIMHELMHFYQFEEDLYSIDSFSNILQAELLAEKYALYACKILQERFRVSYIPDNYIPCYTTRESQQFLYDWYYQ